MRARFQLRLQLPQPPDPTEMAEARRLEAEQRAEHVRPARVRLPPGPGRRDLGHTGVPVNRVRTPGVDA